MTLFNSLSFWSGDSNSVLDLLRCVRAVLDKKSKICEKKKNWVDLFFVLTDQAWHSFRPVRQKAFRDIQPGADNE